MDTTEIIFAVIGAALTLTGVVAAGAQAWSARAANEQAKIAARQAGEQRRNEDKRAALAMCEPLTTREVHAILMSTSPEPEALNFLATQVALYDARSLLLSGDKNGPVEATISAALDPVRAVLERHGRKVETPALEAKLGQTDRSRFSWEGAGNHSKIWTINLIAQRWAAERGLTARAEFERSFADQLRAAVPDRADEYSDTWLLTPDDERYLPSRPLTLDGGSYGVHWRCGFKNSQIGSGVHKPIIEFFRDTHGYPVAAL